MQKLLITTLLVLLTFFYKNSYADPWFTGPLLATSAQTVDRGHFYAFLNVGPAISSSIYDKNWATTPQLHYSTTQIAVELGWGLTDRIDLEYDFLYEINQNQITIFEKLGDTLVTVGFQALSQEKNPKLPDLRITLQQLFPTGTYDQFNPLLSGVESTGVGAYLTALGLNFQYLSQLSEQHYLNSHFNIAYVFASDTYIQGLSTYGGTSETKGTINPGNAVNIDLAEELSLTKNWAAVIEANFLYQQASSFKGVVGTIDLNRPRIKRLLGLLPTKHNIGNPEIGSGNLDQFSLAPAIEYNMSENFGVISGVWFTVAGKNAPTFVMPLIQFSATW